MPLFGISEPSIGGAQSPELGRAGALVGRWPRLHLATRLLAAKCLGERLGTPRPRRAWVITHTCCLFVTVGIVVLASTFPAMAKSVPACAANTGKGHSYANQDLTNHNFSADPAGSLIGADFSGAQLSGAIFSGQDLTNAKFQGAKLGPAKGPVDFTNSTLTNTCFIGATMDETDFSYAVIICADFTETSLIKATFGPVQNIVMGTGCRTRFNGATLDVHLIGNDFNGKSNWSKTDFTAANFQNLTPTLFSLAGKDITGAKLGQTNFTGIDMTGANLTNVDFTLTTLIKAKLDRTAINNAHFYNAQAGSATFICAQGFGNSGGQKLPNGTTCPTTPTSINPTTGADFTFGALKGADFTGATLDHAQLVAANLTSAHFDGASLVQASLQSQNGQTGPAIVQFATFTNAKLNNALLSGVDFSGATLTNAIFDNTLLSGTLFANATMPGASFQSSTLQSVNFSDAILQSAKFNDAKIQAPSVGPGSGANFSCSQLGGADFTNASIAATNFSNAVMPAADACCKVEGGGAPWCGNVDATQQTYGPVTFPVINSGIIVTCPNGSTGQCTGAQWQLSPNWQTTSCNKNGVSQQMWSKPNCGGKPTDIVKFKDPNLKACILATLPGQTEVYLTTAQQISQVNCPGRQITDIGGLENFISLTKLDLRSNALTIFTLAFTAGGKPAPSQLQALSLDNNQLTTLDLTAHPLVVSLSVSNNQLGAISLNANTYLLILDASHNRLSTFNLPIQSNLSFVDLSYNLLTSVLNQYSTNLNGLQALSYLDLSHNVLTTIGSIQTIAYDNNSDTSANLKSLFLACNPKFQCGDLGVYNGTRYPAASSSQCSAYNTATGKWTPLSTPQCSPN
ncbi:MAG: pentapeptide repeat-containing protein [Candidatus Sulfotelmatobacter sp.]